MPSPAESQNPHPPQTPTQATAVGATPTPAAPPTPESQKPGAPAQETAKTVTKKQPSNTTPVVDKKDVEAAPEKNSEETKKTEAVSEDDQKLVPKKLPIRRHILFFIICFVCFFCVIWTIANGWQNSKAGTNEGWFHEILGIVSLLGLCGIAYYKIYRQSRVYLTVVEQREAEERAAREAKEKIEREKKEKTFRKIIADFHAAESFEATSVAMTKLLTVGIESPKLRQEVVSIVGELNQWMYENTIFMSIQQLMAWRIKKALFEKSDRFQIDSGTQDLSIKAINIIEAITKRHIMEFKDNKVDFTLDLSNIAVPTITLTSQYIPAGSVFFENSILWQASFSETIIQGTSFLKADLQKASFWRAKIENVDFEEANLKHAKLRTDLQKARNLTSEQFLNTKEWELCFISREQTNKFFPEQYDTNMNWERWQGARDRREKLYFNFEQI